MSYIESKTFERTSPLLESYNAIANFALVCFTDDLSNEKCNNVFKLLKEGQQNGCPDCTGMLAFYYVTGCRGLIARSDYDAYSLACQSAADGSWFGKMALVHFLNSLLGVQDPDEEKFYVLWTDQFICNFAPQRNDAPVPAAEVSFKVKWEFPFEIWGIILQKTQSCEECEKLYSALSSDFGNELKNLYDAHKDALSFKEFFEPDPNILSKTEILRIARILIQEIKEEHPRNPDMPKVWLNLPQL